MARSLGRSVRELLVTVDAAELAEWEVFFAKEPWGEARRDQQTALIACLLANQWRDKGAPAKLRDFLPDYWQEGAPDNRAKMLAAGKAFAAATRAKDQGR